jgi:RHS repeat-associated protein
VGQPPYGETYANSVGTNFNFTGMDNDTKADLFDFPARDYHPTQGRWIMPDPAGLAAVDLKNPQTWNRYTYVGNNPLAAVDPLGLKCGTASFRREKWDNAMAQGCGTGSGQDCMWNDCYGGLGGGPVYVDGLPQTKISGLGGNALIVCPNHDCSGYGTRWDVDPNGNYLAFRDCNGEPCWEKTGQTTVLAANNGNNFPRNVNVGMCGLSGSSPGCVWQHQVVPFLNRVNNYAGCMASQIGWNTAAGTAGGAASGFVGGLWAGLTAGPAGPVVTVPVATTIGGATGGAGGAAKGVVNGIQNCTF